jgi:hypothetical protein
MTRSGYGAQKLCIMTERAHTHLLFCSALLCSVLPINTVSYLRTVGCWSALLWEPLWYCYLISLTEADFFHFLTAKKRKYNWKWRLKSRCINSSTFFESSTLLSFIQNSESCASGMLTVCMLLWTFMLYGYIPYILEYNTHPNLICTQVLAIS